ncbi:MAG: ATP-binding cassette domain-containing protein [Acholeplasmatales bacterium]|nr:ATP-binding cassette domain-containing protein [Acholeplasmatales bacterium]
MDIILDTLMYGIPYAILALGVFISYRVLDFADLSCEGTYVLGAATSLVMIANGNNAIIATIVGVIAGALGGLITGLLNTKLKINGLLAGIITLTACFSINLVIFGITKGESFSWSDTYNSFRTLKVSTGDDPTIFSFFGGLFSIRKYGLILELAIILAAIIGILYAFFGTEVGMSMRAAGMNKKMARTQGINTDFYVIIGLMISNGLIALAGSLGAQRDYTVSSVSGTGMIVIGLASIIIGEALFGKRSFINWLISVAFGAIVYYLIIAVALYLGFPSHLLKVLYAILIVIILAIGFVKEKYHFEFNIFGRIKNAIFKKKNTDTAIEEMRESEDITLDTAEVAQELSQIAVAPEAEANTGASMLEVRNATKVFNRSGNKEDVKVALNDMSIDIKDGEFVTIIGGNGSGKSTFFNCVSGVYKLEEGQIFINGKDVTKTPEYLRARYIGRVAQDPYQGTAQNMSILENLSIASRRNRMKTLKWGFNAKNTEKYKDLLKPLNLGLERRMGTKIGLLSGGQRQAVTLLMATLERPDVLFLDEHTAALDPKTAKTVLELTEHIVRTNRLTTVMVTHNMKDAIKYGDRLLMFNNGKCIYDVSGEEKKNLTVEALLKKFENVEFTDKDILG